MRSRRCWRGCARSSSIILERERRAQWVLDARERGTL